MCAGGRFLLLLHVSPGFAARSPQTAIESYAASFSSANELDINQQTAQGLPVVETVEFSKGKKPGVQLDQGLVAGTVIKHAAEESPLHNFVDYQLPG